MHATRIGPLLRTNRACGKQSLQNPDTARLTESVRKYHPRHTRQGIADISSRTPTARTIGTLLKKRSVSPGMAMWQIPERASRPTMLQT
jgi:hypothetical protein